MMRVPHRCRAVLGVACAWALIGSALPREEANTGEPEENVTARLDVAQGRYTVGDPVSLVLTVDHPPGVVFDTPDLSGLRAGEAGGESFVVEEIEPIEHDPPRPAETSWRIRLRAFAPGEIEIPAIALTYRPPGGGDVRTISTPPRSITIDSVLKKADETPADIRGPWRIPPDVWRILLLVVLALAVLGVAVLLWRRYGRRRRGAPAGTEAGPATPVVIPYERAMRDLDRLLAMRLVEQGRIKEFHVRLAEIVKRFLGDEHGFDAMDRTTEEFLADLSRCGLGDGLRERTGGFLLPCDLVKFAKHEPTREEIDATIQTARALIATGRRAPEDAAA
ncbi:MAG: hypothetical protein ACE5HU_01815 [Acidobacteriota bacterium]